MTAETQVATTAETEPWQRGQKWQILMCLPSDYCYVFCIMILLIAMPYYGKCSFNYEEVIVIAYAWWRRMTHELCTETRCGLGILLDCGNWNTWHQKLKIFCKKWFSSTIRIFDLVPLDTPEVRWCRFTWHWAEIIMNFYKAHFHHKNRYSSPTHYHDSLF